METALRALSLSYTYKGKEGFCVALPELELKEGEITALTGVSGSGKSTLLECLGLLRPGFESKRFEVCGEDLRDRTHRELSLIRSSVMGFMPQQGGLIPFLSVRGNLEVAFDLAAASRKRLGIEIPSRKNALASALEMCAQLGISDYLERYPKELSIGQAQRASFVRASVHTPKVLFVDEPTSALDPPRAFELFTKIKDLVSEKRIAALVVTHDTLLSKKCGFVSCAYDRSRSSESKSVFCYASSDKKSDGESL